MTIERLQAFVDEIRTTIPLSRVWMTRRKELSRFAQAVSEQTFSKLPFLKGEAKTFVAEHAVPFTVTDVRGPIEKDQLDFSKKRMIKTYTYYLDLVFEDKDILVVGAPAGIELEMTLSFAANYEGRDKKIEGLREDLESGILNKALLTGDINWYDLAVAS